MNSHEKPHFTGSNKDDADLFVGELMGDNDKAQFLQRLSAEPELIAALQKAVREVGSIDEQTYQSVVKVLGPTWLNDGH